MPFEEEKSDVGREYANTEMNNNLSTEKDYSSNVSVKSKLQHPPPGHTPGIWRLFLSGREGIWLT